jgi:hypothetical protein
MVFSACSNKTDHHYIAEILLKVALNTITLTLEAWLAMLSDWLKFKISSFQKPHTGTCM